MLYFSFSSGFGIRFLTLGLSALKISLNTSYISFLLITINLLIILLKVKISIIIIFITKLISAAFSQFTNT